MFVEAAADCGLPIASKAVGELAEERAMMTAAGGWAAQLVVGNARPLQWPHRALAVACHPEKSNRTRDRIGAREDSASVNAANLRLGIDARVAIHDLARHANFGT
jgi:hypothetical protein